MERRKIMPALLAILAAAVLFLAVYFLVMYRRINYLPDEALDDLCEILADDDIFLDREIVPLRRDRGTIYVCESEGYHENVAVTLGGDEIKYRFAIPDGETILLYNGAILEFTSGFAFHYRMEQGISLVEEFETDGAYNIGTSEEAEEAVQAFLDRGNSGFAERENLNIVTEIAGVYRAKVAGEDVVFVECVRTIDGLEITENRVICAVQNGVVAEAQGKWCFLTLGRSYSSQLTDIFNILFSVKKEIDGTREAEERVRIQRIARCYTLFYLGDDGGFCFIPCWQIVTDRFGEFIYNGVDGTLYTKKTSRNADIIGKNTN